MFMIAGHHECKRLPDLKKNSVFLLMRFCSFWHHSPVMKTQWHYVMWLVLKLFLHCFKSARSFTLSRLQCLTCKLDFRLCKAAVVYASTSPVFSITGSLLWYSSVVFTPHLLWWALHHPGSVKCRINKELLIDWLMKGILCHIRTTKVCSRDNEK